MHPYLPLQRPDSIPWLVCPLGIALLSALSELLARQADTSATVSRRASQRGSQPGRETTLP
jgi:hypothetical protein